MATPTPGYITPQIGDSVETIETPAIVIDLDQMESNMAWYGEFAERHDVRLRSHVKTHKTPDIAHKQSRLPNARGILCQTLGEVEVMAQNGITDIYLSYMIVQPSQLERLVRLSEKLDQFATTVDSPGNVDPLQAVASKHDVTIDVVLEMDAGMGRVGAPPGEAMVELGEYVDAQSNLSIAGLMTFEGHAKKGAETEAEVEAACLEVMDTVAETVEQLEAAGIPIDDVKVGSTGTSRYSGTHEIATEINPGMYPFFDATVASYPIPVSLEDCALHVLSTVMSVPTDDRVVVDAGSKTISMDASLSPVAIDEPGLDYFKYSEEHGWIDTTQASREFRVGDRITWVPPHVCTTVNLHDVIIGVRDGIVEETWSVQGRGKVR